VLPGTDASKSLVFGPLIESEVIDTVPTYICIKAKDKYGNDIPTGGDPFEVTIEDENGKVTDIPLTDNGDGSYKSGLIPVKSGRHKVGAKLRTKPVGGAPFTIDVGKGATEQSFVERFSFTIRTKTSDGKLKKDGGDKFDITVENPAGNNVEGLHIDDKNDGTYVVTYAVETTGEYVVRIKIHGKHIVGSPWRQLHFVE